jgi:transcriptional regulator NrdR family protein
MKVIVCERCGSESMVIDSRPFNGTVRRRRKCLGAGCSERWSTLEFKKRKVNHIGGEKSADRGHQMVKFFFSEKLKQNVSYEQISSGSGVPIKTMKNWKRHPAPNLSNIDAALGFLGYQITVEQKDG